MNDCSGNQRVGRIHDDFIGRSHALHDLDGGAEVATYFDIAEFNAIIGFHHSNLQPLRAEQQGVVRQSNDLP